MDARISGMVECWRERGAWYMTIRLPRWVVDDIEHEANGFRICGVGKEIRGNGDRAAVTPFGATLLLVATPRTRQTKEPQDAPTSAETGVMLGRVIIPPRPQTHLSTHTRTPQGAYEPVDPADDGGFA